MVDGIEGQGLIPTKTYVGRGFLRAFPPDRLTWKGVNPLCLFLERSIGVDHNTMVDNDADERSMKHVGHGGKGAA